MTKLIDEMFAILIERGVYRRKTGRQNTASPGMLGIVISRFIKEITSVYCHEQGLLVKPQH